MTGHAPDAPILPARNLLFLNDPARPGHFIDATDTHLPRTNDQTEGVVIAHMNGDGHLDVVLSSPAHPNRLLINDGTGRFTDASDRLDLRVPMETRDVKVVDVNGDGKDDVFIGGWGTQARLLLSDIRAHQKSLPPLPELKPHSKPGASR